VAETGSSDVGEGTRADGAASDSDSSAPLVISIVALVVAAGAAALAFTRRRA
jgi:MYXO-CTERM domain-containing protein